VDDCFSTLPPQIRTGHTIAVFLNAAKDILGSELGALVGTVAYMKMIYHGIVVALSSPPDDQLYSGMVEDEWIGSEAFLLAQEHAMQATALLQPLVESEDTITQMGLPVRSAATFSLGGN